MMGNPGGQTVLQKHGANSVAESGYLSSEDKDLSYTAAERSVLEDIV